MKKYYLHNGTESSGPFDMEELKAQKITKKTPVWFEGMERWNTAGEINELANLFIPIPPPIDTFSTSSSGPNVDMNTEDRKILGLSKNNFFITCGALIILVGILVLNSIQEKRSQELKIKNHKTEIENYQLELKQKELEEQKIQAVIQEKIDAERIARENKANASNRLLEINKLLADYQNKMDASVEKLKDVSGFKLLRTAAEKQQQMDLLQKNIDSFKNEMNLLKNEADQLKLELEKIPE